MNKHFQSDASKSFKIMIEFLANFLTNVHLSHFARIIYITEMPGTQWLKLVILLFISGPLRGTWYVI